MNKGTRTIGSVASLLATIMYQGNHDLEYRINGDIYSMCCCCLNVVHINKVFHLETPMSKDWIAK